MDGNAKTDVSNRREPGSFCGEAEQPQTFISETSYVKIVFHTDNFTDQVSQPGDWWRASQVIFCINADQLEALMNSPGLFGGTFTSLGILASSSSADLLPVRVEG